MHNINHKERAHALLSPSSAHRWLNCNTQPRATEHIEDTTSVFAQEGTLAHELCEVKLRAWQGLLTEQEVQMEKARIAKHELYNPEMEEFTDGYVAYVQEKYNGELAHTPDAILSIEERVDYSDYVPEGDGSCDANIVSNKKLIVIDFKYGRGVSVYATENEQAKLYGLGALLKHEMFYAIEEIELCIYQPRTSNFSEWTTTPAELKTWAKYYVKPRAALAFEGKGETRAGDWCKFCPIAGTCITRANTHLEQSAEFFDLPKELSNEQLGEVLLKFDAIKDWMKAAEEAAFNKAMAGEEISHHKLVEGRSRRKYTDEVEVLTTLVNAGVETKDVTETTLISITKLEKTLGKKKVNELVGSLIDKPAGSPTLVRDTDKRPECVLESDLFDDLII